MKVAVIGSRTIHNADIGAFLPRETTLIISGGAKGVDSLAESYAKLHGLPILIFRPDYEKSPTLSSPFGTDAHAGQCILCGTQKKRGRPCAFFGLRFGKRRYLSSTVFHFVHFGCALARNVQAAGVAHRHAPSASL